MTQGIKCVLVLLTVCFLSGCMNAAVTGAQAVYDQHNIRKTLDDHYITMQAYQSIYNNNNQFKGTSVSVATLNKVVLLTGQVNHPEQQASLEQIVKKIPNVKQVYNFTAATNALSPLVQASDTWITTKIKAKLIASEEVDPSEIKVVTENGVVYLMGIIPPSQAKAAVQLARTTEGVQRVVKIFLYLRISKT